MGPRPSGGPRAATTKKKGSPSTRNIVKLARFILTAGLALVLAIVLVRMILPDREEPPTSKEGAVESPSPKGSTGVVGEQPIGGEVSASDKEIDEVRAFRGEGAEPADDPRITWEIALEYTGQGLSRLEGRIVQDKTTGEPPQSELDFSIAPSRYRITAREEGVTTFDYESAFDPTKGSVFSIDGNDRLFILLTPAKLQMPPESIPGRFLTKGMDTPLIYMQGLVRKDGDVIGTFRSAFVPSFEYLLVPSPPD